MIVLAIDPGTNFGWATPWEGRYKSGFIELSKEPTERMCQFYIAIHSLADQFTPSVVAVETVHPKSAAQAKIIYGQLAIVRALASEMDYAVLEIPASKWKKEVLGKGNVSKEDTMALLMVDNEHEADAVGVMIYVQRDGVRE